MSSILSPPRWGETYLRIDRFPQKITAIKQRLRSAKFQEHFKQAQLFYNSLSEVEKAHVLAAYSFELSHCDDPVVYESWTRLLNNVDFPVLASFLRRMHNLKLFTLTKDNCPIPCPSDPEFPSWHVGIYFGDAEETSRLELVIHLLRQSVGIERPDLLDEMVRMLRGCCQPATGNLIGVSIFGHPQAPIGKDGRVDDIGYGGACP